MKRDISNNDDIIDSRDSHRGCAQGAAGGTVKMDRQSYLEGFQRGDRAGWADGLWCGLALGAVLGVALTLALIG